MRKRERIGALSSPERVVAPIKSKGIQFDLDAARIRSCVDHQIQGEIFHGRIEIFFSRFRQAVDFIDEKDVAQFQVGQKAGQIARFFDGRARCHSELRTHRFGNDVGQRRLSQVPEGRKKGNGPRASLRFLAASMKISSRARTDSCPTKSDRRCGRRGISKVPSGFVQEDSIYASLILKNCSKKTI